jgi:hypothetical protein
MLNENEKKNRSKQGQVTGTKKNVNVKTNKIHKQHGSKIHKQHGSKIHKQHGSIIHKQNKTRSLKRNTYYRKKGKLTASAGEISGTYQASSPDMVRRKKDKGR